LRTSSSNKCARFDPDEKGYTRQEITRMRNNIVKATKLLARLRETPLPLAGCRRVVPGR
jgi:hypothetical protein